jgi:riboflavin synthase
MFTGIVETTAKLRSLVRSGPEARMALEVSLDDYQLGESISVSGVCLTVVEFGDWGFAADVSAETLAVTTLGALANGDRVNIERSLAMGQRMGGHVVLGHVDAVGKVSQVERVRDAWRVAIDAPVELARYFAAKGSVAVDGVSLTINRLVGDSGFELMLVPHTLEVTTLGDRAPGDAVNLEVDVLARYVARQLDHAGLPSSAGARDQTLMKKLAEGGFL